MTACEYTADTQCHSDKLRTAALASSSYDRCKAYIFVSSCSTHVTCTVTGPSLSLVLLRHLPDHHCNLLLLFLPVLTKAKWHPYTEPADATSNFQLFFDTDACAWCPSDAQDAPMTLTRTSSTTPLIYCKARALDCLSVQCLCSTRNQETWGMPA